MCFLFKKKVEPIITPSMNEYKLTSDQVFQLVKDTKDHVYMWDGTYWALSFNDWQSVFKDILSSLPKYLAEKFDCEDFAFICMSRVTEKYGVNTCGVAVGQSPMGYHGFNIFVSWDNGQASTHILEPQTGIIDPQGYIPEIIIFG